MWRVSNILFLPLIYAATKPRDVCAMDYSGPLLIWTQTGVRKKCPY